MPTTKPKVSDFTGRQRAQQAKEREAELKARANEIAMANAVEAEVKENEVIDTTADGEVILLDEIETVAVDLADETVIIQVLEDIEDMTFGVGNNYTFEVGRKYKVSKDLARHLEEKGYLWGSGVL